MVARPRRTAPVLYNEFDAYPAAWLRNLAAAGHIAPGVVDDRSIEALTPADVAGRVQAHFFAGIGVWSYALRLAGWPDDRPVWTGSCPCQPFSQAGRGKGFDDERHLWPAWFELIRECRPPVVFGEQVASPDGLVWFDTVRADLEDAGYAVGVADLCAAGVGAPHLRQRLFFVAHTEEAGRGARGAGEAGRGAREPRGPRTACGLADTDEVRLQGLGADADPEGRRGPDVPAPRLRNGAGALPWQPADWLPCRDGKARPVEPGTFPLAHGAPARVGRLRAYGNAIVPQVAAVFVSVCMDAPDLRA